MMEVPSRRGAERETVAPSSSPFLVWFVTLFICCMFSDWYRAWAWCYTACNIQQQQQQQQQQASEPKPSRPCLRMIICFSTTQQQQQQQHQQATSELAAQACAGPLPSSRRNGWTAGGFFGL
jgi:hypothetical protein